jgi:hypothetical protein
VKLSLSNATQTSAISANGLINNKGIPMATVQVTIEDADGFVLVTDADDFLAVNNGGTTIYACFADSLPSDGAPTFPVHPGAGVVRNGVVGNLYSTTGRWGVS